MERPKYIDCETCGNPWSVLSRGFIPRWCVPCRKKRNKREFETRFREQHGYDYKTYLRARKLLFPVS